MESVESLWECDDELADLDDVEDDDPQPAPTRPALAQPEPLEDGEIGPASGGLHADSSFQFRANDLDAAVRSAKKSQRANKPVKLKGKKKKRSHRKKVEEMDPNVFIVRTSRLLREPKQYLIKAAVERLGIDVVHNLVQEVEAIEHNGGQMTANGGRRRTPGGVLWNVLRSRYEEDYKAVMAAGRNYEKQNKQQKRKMEKDDMIIDGQPSMKRRKTGPTESSLERDMAPPVAQVKRTGVTVWPSRCRQMVDTISKVDPDNSHILSRVQSAWEQGVKKGKHIRGHDDVDMLDDAMNTKPSSVADRLRIPIQYDDL